MSEQKPKILFIENDANYASRLKQSLIHVLEVIVCSTKDKAIDTLKNPIDVELILLDIHLFKDQKDYSGFDLLRPITQALPGVPILALTGDDSRTTTYKAFKNEANIPVIDILVKQKKGFTEIYQRIEEEITKRQRRPADYFLSHNQNDQFLVEFLRELFRRKGKKLSLKKNGVPAGKSLHKEIAQQILEAKTFAPLLTPNSITSDWVEKEFAFADKKKKPIVPLLYNITEEDLPGHLSLIVSDLRYINLDDFFLPLSEAIIDLNQNT